MTQTLLELAIELNLFSGTPTQAASTNGGEYHCSCPECGGKDRFILHPYKGSGWAWCRRCKIGFSRIQFAVKYFGKGCTTSSWATPFKNLRKRKNFFTVDRFISPSAEWISAIEQLRTTFALGSDRLNQLKKERGITSSNGTGYQIGFNPTPLEREIDGCVVPLPVGWYIFILSSAGVCYRVKIRSLSKTFRYLQIKGGHNKKFGFFGDDGEVIIVESEFDGILLAQELNTRVFSLGGATNYPCKNVYNYLLFKKCFYICPDNDEAGANLWKKWFKEFPNARLLKPKQHKSAGDMFLAGINLKEWFSESIL